MIRRAVLLAALLAGAASPLPAAELTRLPGTCVELAPPPGMIPASEFAGFADPKKGSAMLVVELPVQRKEVPEFLSALSDEALAAQGLIALERGALPQGVPGNLLIRAEHSAHGIPFERWIYVAPSERALAMITVQVPQQFATDAAEADLKASLATVRIMSELATGLPPPDAVEALPFGYEAGERFAVRSVIAGNTVLLHAAAAEPERSEAILLISKSLAMGDEDHLEMSSRALESLEGVQRIEIDEMYDEVAIGELTGIELTARCTEKGSGEPCVAYQMMLFDTGAVYRVLGVTHADLAGAYLPEFRRTARSLMPK
ncbi:MAG TPA: hypothetical protein VFZ10_08245 [Geminicoccaceae bacterium]